jgi:hypothetical protein
MTISELNRMVDHEIQWLSYYSTSESRSKLTIGSDIYSELEVMGYCKTPTPLQIRCSICLLSNGSVINEQTQIESLKPTNRIREEFDYTPLEAFLLMFPSKKEETLNRLKPIESEWKPHFGFKSKK